MAMTAGKAAKKFGISRTALLYYDEIGLVSPSMRSASGYRIYDEGDLERLRSVLAYREAGIGLDDIAGLLRGSGSSLEAVLLRRLSELNGEIVAAKKRQAAVIGMIQGLAKGEAAEDVRRWRAGLEEAGIVEDKAERLHSEMEANSPEMHVSFLRALGFGDEEIRVIREHHKHG
jgi:DNA-binding transcriptional MerR regulator